MKTKESGNRPLGIRFHEENIALLDRYVKDLRSKALPTERNRITRSFMISKIVEDHLQDLLKKGML